MPWAQPMQVPRFAQPADVETHAPSAPTGSAPPSSLTAEGAAAAKAAAEDAEALHIAALVDHETKKIKARRKAEERASEEFDRQRTVELRPASSYIMRRTKWLWRGRVPIGEVTLIGGKGGIGKSQTLCMLTAWITTGRMKGEYLGTPRNVIYVANEDSVEATVLPRLIAAGADPSRVFMMTVSNQGDLAKLSLTHDLPAIAEKASGVEAAAIMFDPLSSNLGVKSNSGDEVRPVFESLRRMAEEQELAVVGLGHLRKGSGSDFLEAFLGSSEMGNVIRAAMGVVRDEDDDEGGIVLTQVKNNLGRMDLPSYKLRILTAEVEDEWGRTFVTSAIDQTNIEKTDQDAQEMMREAMAFGESRSKVREAADFLLDYLASKGGEAPRKEIMSAARGEGISQTTIERSARKLKLTTTRQRGFQSGTIWSLPVTSSMKGVEVTGETG